MQGTERQEAGPIPSTTNPKELITGFLQSEHYKEAYDSFYASPAMAEYIADRRKTLVFQNSEAARKALISFSENKLKLKLNVAEYPEEVQVAIHEYIDAAQKLESITESENRDGLFVYKALRSSAHRTLSDRLFLSKIVPSSNLGITLSTLLLIDQGLDTFESAKMARSGKAES